VSVDVSSGWDQVDAPQIVELWAEQYPGVEPPTLYRRGMLQALVGREPVDPDGVDVRWHISISRPDRLPSWDDVVSAAHDLRPGVVFVIGVPPRSWWVNIHRYTLHLYETRDAMLVEQWRAEGRGDRPT
jgi:hypothetical protein